MIRELCFFMALYAVWAFAPTPVLVIYACVAVVAAVEYVRENLL